MVVALFDEFCLVFVLLFMVCQCLLLWLVACMVLLGLPVGWWVGSVVHNFISLVVAGSWRRVHAICYLTVAGTGTPIVQKKGCMVASW